MAPGPSRLVVRKADEESQADSDSLSEKPYVCPNPRCGKRYKSRNGLFCHRTRGLKCGEKRREKRFVCPTLDCQKRFGTKVGLGDHLRDRCGRNRDWGDASDPILDSKPVCQSERAVGKRDQGESGSSQPQEPETTSFNARLTSFLVWPVNPFSESNPCANPLCGQSYINKHGLLKQRMKWFCSNCEEIDEIVTAKYIPTELGRRKRLKQKSLEDGSITSINESQCKIEEQERREENPVEGEVQEAMTAREIESCSSLEDLLERLHSAYKHCQLPTQPNELLSQASASPDNLEYAKGIHFAENDDSNSDTLPHDLAEPSQLRFAGEYLAVQPGPPERLKTDSAGIMILILAKLLAREKEGWPYSVESVKNSGHLIHIVCRCNCKRALREEEQVYSPDTEKCCTGRPSTSPALQDNSPDSCPGFLEVLIVTQCLEPDWSSYQNRVTFTFCHPMISRRTSSGK